MKIVIFGAGKFYQEKKHKIPAKFEIVAFLDNNSQYQGKKIDGHLVVAPNEILQLSYDKIVLMSTSEEAMKSQLIELGVDKKDIWYWERFASEICRGELRFYCGNRNIKNCGKRVLIISTHLSYSGGPLAAVYAAKVLQDRDYVVFLTAPSGDERFIDEAIKVGLNIALCPALPYVHKEELIWIEQFDVVLVNVFPMILCACEISKIRPVLWWIHESEESLYYNIINKFEGNIEKEQMEKITIYGVSRVAQSKFNFCFSNNIKKILPYGIPDQIEKNSYSNNIENQLVFAMIGTVHRGKAQDVFVNAIELIDAKEKKNVQFLIIGFIGIDEYSNEIKKSASRESTIKITGLLTRSELSKAYEKIDVIVCPSLEDSLPIVVTEGMMQEKVCIVSDMTGTAEYIEDGKNGLLCKAGDSEDLCEKIRWVIKNRKKLPEMGREARKVYEEYFTMDSFGQRLEESLEEAIDNFYAMTL